MQHIHIAQIIVKLVMLAWQLRCREGLHLLLNIEQRRGYTQYQLALR